MRTSQQPHKKYARSYKKNRIHKKKEYLKDGNCMTSNILVLNIHQFEDTKEWLKMVLLNHQAFLF